MATITGDEFSNVLIGTSKPDIITGLGGKDAVFGGRGDDILDGGYGDDIILGANGKDTITGGFGDDYILGQNGDDLIISYGFDASTFTVSIDKDFVDGGNGDDDISGSNGSDTLLGGAGDDRLEGEQISAVGGGAGDRLFGGIGDDLILPRWGDDFSDGGRGDDIIDLTTPRRGAPPQNPDGEDTVQFSFKGAGGDQLGHDQVLFLLDEDKLLFNDLNSKHRIDTLDELAGATTFEDTGLNTYRIDWKNGDASIDIQVQPMQFGPQDAYDSFITLQQFSSVFHIDFI